MAVTELHKRRLGRNLAVAGGLMVLVVLFFAITIVKFGGAS